MTEWKLAAGDWIWGERVTRFFKIKAVLSTEEALQRIADLGFEGVELSWVSPETYPPEKVKRTVESLRRLNLDVANVYVDTAAKWPFGAFTNKNQQVREEVVRYVKSCIDVALALGSPMVNIWPGSDGVPLSADYWTAWNWFIEGFSKCVEYAEKVNAKISLEYKLREPCYFQLLANSDAALRVIDAIRSTSLGATIDTGHLIQAKEHLPTTVEKLGRALFHVHLDDNYGDWDDDLAVGEVHSFQDFFKALRRIDYKGYLTLDLWPLTNPDEAVLKSKEYVERVAKETVK